MSISGIGSGVNTLQSISAQNAFQKTLRNIAQSQKQPEVPKEPEKININQPTIKEKLLMNEVKQFADQYNMTDVEDDEIHYAIKYGTSLLADHFA